MKKTRKHAGNKGMLGYGCCGTTAGGNFRRLSPAPAVCCVQRPKKKEGRTPIKTKRTDRVARCGHFHFRIRLASSQIQSYFTVQVPVIIMCSLHVLLHIYIDRHTFRSHNSLFSLLSFQTKPFLRASCQLNHIHSLSHQSSLS